MNYKIGLTIAATSLLSIAVQAGYTQPASVTIEIDTGVSGSAIGDMLTARNSKNDYEFIGCGVRALDNGAGFTYSYGFCQAGLEEDVSYTCFTESPVLIEAMNLIAESSFITFSWVDDGDGNLTCNFVGSSSQSFYLPAGKSNKELTSP